MTNNESASSVAIGFVLAVGNHTYGWFNAILQTHNLGNWSQAIITGCLGSLGAFCTTRLLKYLEKKIKNNDKKNENSVT
jgi:hypothetical protein